jgi:teichuronic acid biosynthesis glycosyltransferase TuaG
MNQATVSIITPAYRSAAFIESAIRSAQAQDYQQWEMIVVDDCSPDDTCSRVADIEGQDQRVRLVRQAANAGPAAARNVALEMARGRYIAFLDSDDMWLPGKLSAQLQFLQKNKAAISYTEYRRISQDGAIVGRHIKVPDALTYNDLLRNTAIVTSSVVVDRAITGPFLMPIAPYDDYALWLLLLRSGNVARGLRRDYLRYRVVADSVSRSTRLSASRVWSTYRDVESLGLARSAWSFSGYAVRGWLKYRRF